MTTVLVLNGPNLGRLGSREPDVYGNQDLAALKVLLEGEKLGEIDLRQTDDEGELIGWLHEAADGGSPVIDAGPGGTVVNASVTQGVGTCAPPSGSTVTCTLGTMAPGASTTIKALLTTPSTPPAGGIYSATTTAHSSNPPSRGC